MERNSINQSKLSPCVQQKGSEKVIGESVIQLSSVTKKMVKNSTNQISSSDEIITSEAKDSRIPFDPMCDPGKPKVIQFQTIEEAAQKIKDGIIRTPCTKSKISSSVGMEVHFKKDFQQYTGSFKERGARFTLIRLSDEQRAAGVISASAGNHAQALAYHGKMLNVPVTVVMPLLAPIVKVTACRQLGANVRQYGADMEEAKQFALRTAKENQLLYINGYDHPDILSGQGTIALEFMEQVQDIDAVVVPIGGGGLIAGVSLAIKSMNPKIQVIGVEADVCASFSASLKAGKPSYVKANASLADGLIVPVVGVNAFATASKYVDKVVTVNEEWIARAILQLLEVEKSVIEGAGAVGLAAIMAGKLPELAGKRVVIPLSGGNIDSTILSRCIERGMAADGRLVKFTVTLNDRPGGIPAMTQILSEVGVVIRDLSNQRAWTRSSIFQLEVKCVCETRDFKHFLELKAALESSYGQVKFKLPVEMISTVANGALA